MQKLLTILLTVAFVLSVPVVASAAKGAGKGAGKGGGNAGKVTAVDATAKTITISHGKGGEAKTFKVADDAKITVAGADGKLADITTDMVARVTEGATPGTASAIEAKKHEKKKK